MRIERGNAVATRAPSLLVQAHPRVKQATVFTPPGDVAFDRRERIALLPGRAHGRDQAAQLLSAGELAHAAEQLGGQPALARVGCDLRSQGTQGVHRRARAALGDDPLQRIVDPGRQLAVVTAPRQRSRVCFGEHDVGMLVIERELELRQLLKQRRPPLIKDVAVPVVFGPHSLGRRPALCQIRALRPRQQAHAHTRSVPCLPVLRQHAAAARLPIPNPALNRCDVARSSPASTTAVDWMRSCEPTPTRCVLRTTTRSAERDSCFLPKEQR
jgi:hypothetical protein